MTTVQRTGTRTRTAEPEPPEQNKEETGSSTMHGVVWWFLWVSLCFLGVEISKNAKATA